MIPRTILGRVTPSLLRSPLRPVATLLRSRPRPLPLLTTLPSQRRHYASPTADALMSSLQDLYATAKDEFETAHASSTAQTPHASSDRLAARCELENFKAAVTAAVRHSAPAVGAEVQRRVGSRVRELSRAVEAMEEGGGSGEG